jgi:hypothetical protein
MSEIKHYKLSVIQVVLLIASLHLPSHLLLTSFKIDMAISQAHLQQ